MKFEITLQEADYLNELLFKASKAKLVHKNRLTTLVLTFWAFALMAISSYLGNKLFLDWWVFLILAVLSVYLYWLYQRQLIC